MAAQETRPQGVRLAPRILRRALFAALGMLAVAALPPSAAAQEQVKGDVSVSVTSDGYARLIFRLSEEVETEVRNANNIVILSFKKPVDVVVERMAAGASDYIAGARRDPDGRALRIALVRKVRVNTMAAGEQLFVDLLPEPWTGVLPGLPQDVVDELSRRARDAEKRALQQLSMPKNSQGMIRVRVGKQPTFTRYSFDLPRGVRVSNNRDDNKLTLVFDASLKFDLADAQADKPEAIEAIEGDIEDKSTRIEFTFGTKVDIRSFREEGAYVVDVIDAVKDDGEGATHRGNDLPKESAAPKGAERAAAVQGKPASEKPAAAPKVAEAPAKPAATPAEPKPAAAPTPAPAMQQAAASEPPQRPADKPAAKPEPAPERAAAKSEPEMPPPAPAADASAMAAPRPSAPAASAKPEAPGVVATQVIEGTDDLRVKFSFDTPTPAAVFRRADVLWLVFDTKREIDTRALKADRSLTVRNAEQSNIGEARILRIKLERPRLASLTPEGTNWMLTIGDTVETPPLPVAILRNTSSPRTTAIIPLEGAHNVHRITDPDIGDALLVATALGPARGLLKPQDFVEFRALPSVHGVVLQPLADDLDAGIAGDKVVVGRPAGLTLSTVTYGAQRGLGPMAFDTQLWGFDKEANFLERQSALQRLAAEANDQRRKAARLDLARFYLARGSDAEAKGVLDLTLSDGKQTAEDAPALVLRGVTEIRLDHPQDALKDLSNPLVGNQHEAPLWRAVAQTQLGKYAEAREGFRDIGMTLGSLPAELQRLALQKALLAAIEVGDFGAAEDLLHEFETLGVSQELEPRMTLLNGRVAEGIGRPHEALTAYKLAAASRNRPIAAEAQLRELALLTQLGRLSRPEVISDLEGLALTWRGDQTELETLQLLAKLYTDEDRYRDAFSTMRSAVYIYPNSEVARRIQDNAATTFDSLFLGDKGDKLSTIDALSLFYDFRELTPIGRRGDEMIRRLSERLVSVDLLDQAAELLQYQIDHRLQGAARAQVATRLALVYLMNRKPDRALAVLRSTRSVDLSNELRNQRLLIEARALSDLKRHDVALEVIANVPGREAVRLRSDILWGAQHWVAAAEQIELLYGTRWQEWAPLGDAERADLLRAAIGYALGGDPIGLSRFREKYARKMVDGPDARAFDVLTNPTAAGGTEFRDVARSVATVDTLESFLQIMRSRFPDGAAAGGTTSRPPGAQSGAAPRPAPLQTSAR